MRNKYFFLVIFSLALNCAYTQVRVVKPVKKAPPSSTNLAISGGVIRSVLYLTRNVKENNEANGLNIGLLYGGNRIARVAFEYSTYRKISIAPTWYDIKARSFEGNVHFLARFPGDKAYFYPLFGISYNTFKGFYTGTNDFLGLYTIYERNKQAESRWLGVNVGTGFEVFFRPGSLFGEYKMRVGLSDSQQQLNIMDVCLSAGLRLNLTVPSIYGLQRGTRSRYLLSRPKS